MISIIPDASNPNLVPETSRNIEAGAYWNGNVTGANLGARAVVYHNRVLDLIVFQCDANFNCAPQNVNRATLEGVTLALDARFDNGASIGASLDVQSPKDDVTGNLLPRRARRHGTLTAGLPVGPTRLGIEIVGSSLRYDDAANRVRMGGYGTLNLTAEWTVGNGVTLFARADNVLDKDYELASGFARSGATVFAGVRARFR
jgi:vitamin B12 transporter